MASEANDFTPDVSAVETYEDMARQMAIQGDDVEDVLEGMALLNSGDVTQEELYAVARALWDGWLDGCIWAHPWLWLNKGTWMMTKKQPNLVTSTGALNLSDPAVVEHLKETVTDVQPELGLAPVEQKTEEQEQEAIQQEKEIQELEALQQKLEVSLSKAQVALPNAAKTLKLTTGYTP